MGRLYSLKGYEKGVKKRQKAIRDFDKKQKAELRKLKNGWMK